jgi:hypothetical protein
MAAAPTGGAFDAGLERAYVMETRLMKHELQYMVYRNIGRMYKQATPAQVSVQV